MTATTELYLQLQRLYREQAEADVSALERHTRAALQRIGRDPASIGRPAVSLFAKNARNLRRACPPACLHALHVSVPLHACKPRLLYSTCGAMSKKLPLMHFFAFWQSC
jgi:hypothetical protein